MKPMVRRRSRIHVVSRLIRAPEITQLPINFPLCREVEGLWIIYSSSIPAFNLVCDQRSFFQRHPVEQRTNFRGCRGVCEALVGNRADDFMPQWPIGESRSTKGE